MIYLVNKIVALVASILLVLAIVFVIGAAHNSAVYIASASTTVPQQGTPPAQNGNFTFTFTLLNGTLYRWTFPIATYDQYETSPRFTPILRLNNNGKTIYSYDYRSLITPHFFARAVPVLTNGQTAQQFLEQVVNIKNQLISYSLVFNDTAVYPAEVLGSRKGDCKDLGVLMASILEAGNQEANYGMNISFEYVDAENLTDPHTVNHLILYVTFANGTSEYIDTTNILSNAPTADLYGWRYPLICTATGCQTTTICSGSYCDEVGYAPDGNHLYSTCTSTGYVIGVDAVCHLACGGVDYFCNKGYACLLGKCV